MVNEGYKTFLVSYRFEGASWTIQLPARSIEDAKARLGRMTYASVDGELVMTLPAYTGPFAALIANLRNALRSLVTPSR